MEETEKNLSGDLVEKQQDDRNHKKNEEEQKAPSGVTDVTSPENKDDSLAEKAGKPAKVSKKAKKDAGEKESGEVSEASHLEEKEEVQPDIAPVDYSGFSNKELVNTCSILIPGRPVQEIRVDIENIKTHFYKNLKIDYDKKKEAFIKDGGKADDYKPEADPLEEELKKLLDQYKSKKAVYNKQLELEKQANLEEKYRLIEGIENLVNKEESINKTFQEFRALQTRWRSVGLVPQSKLKNLWESYHYHVEKFYDYIKINKELRDLDLKKNMEMKNYLCDKAENLLLEPNVVLAFKTLQEYHDRWREIGPVPHEIKEALWERFRSVTSKINKKHQEYFESLKEGLKKNLQAKTDLCEKVEQILKEEITSHRHWERRSREIIAIQKIWKTIGFAPKKYNSQIYDRFRTACDSFFSRKREFYAENKEIQKNNLQLKTDICIQAEALQNSEEWKKTTEDLIQLQKKWKEIGPASKKHSDEIWKRFRKACDTFFTRKSEYFSNIDKKYKENLDLKIKLISDIKQIKFGEDMEGNFKKLQDFQRQWSEIGFVPIKEKEKISKEYRDAIDHLFDELKIEDGRKDLLRFRNKIGSMTAGRRSTIKLNSEREKYVNKLKKLESDIVLWENNIGFFAKSKNAEALIAEVTGKIEQSKKNAKLLEGKIKMIDQMNNPKT